MLQIQTTNLSQDQQQRLHPDFLANEQVYLQMRDRLLPQYRGQWVAVHDGKVIAGGPTLMEVMEKASTSGGHPYIALVGAEDGVVFRVRRARSLLTTKPISGLPVSGTTSSLGQSAGSFPGRVRPLCR